MSVSLLATNPRPLPDLLPLTRTRPLPLTRDPLFPSEPHDNQGKAKQQERSYHPHPPIKQTDDDVK